MATPAQHLVMGPRRPGPARRGDDGELMQSPRQCNQMVVGTRRAGNVQKLGESNYKISRQSCKVQRLKSLNQLHHKFRNHRADWGMTMELSDTRYQGDYHFFPNFFWKLSCHYIEYYISSTCRNPRDEVRGRNVHSTKRTTCHFQKN